MLLCIDRVKLRRKSRKQRYENAESHLSEPFDINAIEQGRRFIPNLSLFLFPEENKFDRKNKSVSCFIVLQSECPQSNRIEYAAHGIWIFMDLSYQWT